ncbi:ATP-binding protein [Streptomyces sp. NPDC050504]|uniref:ATP-binding protein n=1 Tax=Streptomyces sp. NPDC050504 TaxID=3365618 RepID=UPI0037A79A8C
MIVPQPENPNTEPNAVAPLLERDVELRHARTAVDALRGGPGGTAPPKGGLLVYSGEAGIGKTALLAEIGRLAAERSTVWSARGGEIVASVPFHVVRQLLQPALSGLRSVQVEDLLGDRFGIVGPALGIALPTASPTLPEGVRDGLDVLVDGLAEENGPLVLIVDDAHWCDVETLDWLVSYAERLAEQPVLIVVAYRTDEATGETAEHLRALDSASGEPNRLSAFTPDATARLARTALGAHADDPFCREVWAVTGGNAFGTVELLLKVRNDALDPVEEHAAELRALSASTRGTGLMARLEELGPTTLKFARGAAILGTEISLDLAAKLANIGRAEAEACAQRLRDARILTGTDPLDFVHPLVLDSVYESITPATRTALHGRAAWAITQSGLGEVAASRHLLEVIPDDDPELVEQLRKAAAEHIAVGAPGAARRCLERALAEPPLPEVHAKVLYELGCATLLTSPAETVGHLRAALDIPGLEGDDRVDAVFRLSQALTHNNETGEAAKVVAEEAARTPDGPDRLRLTAVHFLWEGVQAVEEDGNARSRRLADAAEGLRGRDNTEQALLILRAFDGMARGESAEEIVEICDRALVNGRLAPGMGWTNTAWGFEPPALLGLTYAFADRLDRAESLFSQALRSFEEAGWSGGHLAFAHALNGYLLRRRGQLADAERSLRESLRLSARVGDGLPMHWDAACMLIDTLLARGQVDKAQEVADRYGFAPPYPSAIVIPDAPTVRGRLLLAQGRRKEAVAELEAAGEALKRRGRHNVVMAPWAVELARAVADEEPERAAALAAYARDRAERFGTDTAIGESLRCEAALADGGRAVELLSRAVAYLEASPCTYEHALARVEYGIAARSASELRHGLDLAKACSADGLVEQAERALRNGPRLP